MDQTRVTQLLPWRCVLEIGNAKIQSLAYRQFFKETKNKKRKRVRVILRELGVFNDFWIFVGIFGCFEFLIRPTYTKGERFWICVGRIRAGKDPEKSTQRWKNRALFTAPSKFTAISFRKRFWSKYLKFNGFFRRKKKLHVGKPSTKTQPSYAWTQRSDQLRLHLGSHFKEIQRWWFRNPASFPTWEV